jgi:hypothetical protein
MAAILPFHFRQGLRELRRGRPGHRFRVRYEHAQREKPRFRTARRVVLIVGAALCFAIGLVLVVMPGPAFVFFILAGGLLATESKTVARLMDDSEVLVRKILAWAKHTWSSLPVPARVILVCVAVCCTAAALFLGYRFIRG